jgi:hypothetical protein
MSTEPKGSHQRGKPLPAANIDQLKKWYEKTKNICQACRASGVSRPTGRKYLGLTQLPDLDI